MPIESKPERIYLIKNGERFIAKWKYFGNPCTSLDPVTEVFRARRSHYEKLKKRDETGEETEEFVYDVHIVIEHRGKDTVTPEGWISRSYGFSYCQYSDKKISIEELQKKYNELLNLIFSEMTVIFDKWYSAEDGMSAFLETKNKSVLDAFLYKNRLKDHDTTKKLMSKPKKTKAEKRAERIAYAIAHPESTKEYKRKAAQAKD